MLVQPWVIVGRGKPLLSLMFRIFNVYKRFRRQCIRKMKLTTAMLMTLCGVATVLTFNDGAMLLTMVTQVAVVLFKISSLSSFQSKIVFQQAVLWRSRMKGVRI
jgi:hypothetical protein